MTLYHRMEPLCGIRERGAALDRGIVASGSAFVILGALSLEIHQPDLGLKLGNATFMLMCALAIGLRCLVSLNQRSEAMAPSEYDLLIFLYLLWAAYSATYSPSPAGSLVHTAFAATLWLAVLCVKSGRLILTLRLMFWTVAAVAAASLVFWQVAPGLALHPHSSTGAPELRGILEHQLRLGMLTGIALGIVFVAFANRELSSLIGNCPVTVFGAGVAIIAVAFYASYARSPAGALFATLVCCGAFAPRLIVRRATRVVVAAGAVICWFYADELFALVFATESDLTFTGRTKIWQETLAYAGLRPWTGYGLASFDSPAFDKLWVHYRPPSAHNSFLQAYFETGYVGLALIVGLIAALLARGLYTSFLTLKLSYTLFMALYGAFSSVMSVIYAGKPSIFLTFILLIAAQEAHAVTRSRTFYAVQRGRRPGRVTVKPNGERQ